MMNEQTNKQNNQGLENETKWVFLPISKEKILKRTDKYVLFRIDSVATAIINAKFLRAKEHEDMVFFSLPETYEISCRVRDLINGKWTTTREWLVKPAELKELLK